MFVEGPFDGPYLGIVCAFVALCYIESESSGGIPGEIYFFFFPTHLNKGSQAIQFKKTETSRMVKAKSQGENLRAGEFPLPNGVRSGTAQKSDKKLKGQVMSELSSKPRCACRLLPGFLAARLEEKLTSRGKNTEIGQDRGGLSTAL